MEASELEQLAGIRTDLQLLTMSLGKGAGSIRDEMSGMSASIKIEVREVVRDTIIRELTTHKDMCHAERRLDIQEELRPIRTDIESLKNNIKAPSKKGLDSSTSIRIDFKKLGAVKKKVATISGAIAAIAGSIVFVLDRFDFF